MQYPSSCRGTAQLIRRVFVSTVVLCLAGMFAGCEDVQVNWGLEQGPKPKPVPTPAGRLVQQSTTSPSANAAQPKPVAPPAGQQAQAAAPLPAPHQVMNVYQVVLLSGPGPAEAPPGIKHVRLQRSRARDNAKILSRLYLPSGPSGTDDRYTLVYPTPLESDLAAEAALLLDVPKAQGDPPAGGASAVWAWAIGEAFNVFDEAGIPDDRVQRLANQLVHVMPSADLSRNQQWIAGMLAGELLAHRVYDYAAAHAVYRQVESIAQPGSYEQMAGTYARGRALLQDGRREQARQCFETVLGQFSMLRGSEVFERARGTLAQWDRRK